MAHRISVIAAISLALVGCTPSQRPLVPQQPSAQPAGSPAVSLSPSPEVQSLVTVPVAEYRDRRTQKVFGQYIQDRFTGYHTGDDVEYTDDRTDVPVFAIADGRVVEARRASGYGGMMVLAHTVNGISISALYGHLDPASMIANGSAVRRGQQLAILGDHQSTETDGERKHLHFHLWEGGGVKISGYAPTAAALGDYLNPTDFFLANGVDVLPPAREIRYGENATPAPHPTFAGLSFTLPAGWAVEYVPQIESLNLFNLELDGIRTQTARGRSKIFIRTFTADRFLTLSTVDIRTTETLEINGRDARRYRITKRPEVPDFSYQPVWRNQPHTVVDIRRNPGRSVFYVIAYDPVMPETRFMDFINSIGITNE